MKIFDQWQQWQCQGFAFLWALAIMNPNIDSGKIAEELKNEPNMLTPERAWKWFVSKGYIKSYAPVKAIQVKAFLSRGIPMIIWSSYGDFSKCTKENGYTLTFAKNAPFFPHKYTAVLNADDYIMCINSWGDQWGSKGCFFIDRKDYRWLWVPYRIFI
jgi:hypothetical protein